MGKAASATSLCKIQDVIKPFLTLHAHDKCITPWQHKAAGLIMPHISYMEFRKNLSPCF